MVGVIKKYKKPDKKPYIVDKIHKVKKNKEKNYLIEKNNDQEIKLTEPYFANYFPIQSIATKTIGLMGLNKEKEFRAIQNEKDLITVIRSGIPKNAMTNMMNIANLSLVEMADIIHTTDRTLRRYSDTEKLSIDQSERIVELARLYARGEEVFDNLNNFREWMDCKLMVLGNKKPKEYLDTCIGINLLIEELGKIENGIFA